LGRIESPLATIHDPFQHPHVLAVPWPEKLAAAILSEPVDAEDPRWMFQRAPDSEPMVEVVADVISAERQHCHGIPAYLADLRSRGRGGLRAERGGHVYTLGPVEAFSDQR